MHIRRVACKLLDNRECSIFILFLRFVLALRDVLRELLYLLRSLIVMSIFWLWSLAIEI